MVSAVHLGGEGPFLLLRAGPLTLVFRGPHPAYELTAAQLLAGERPISARPAGWGSLREPSGSNRFWGLAFDDGPPPNVESLDRPRLRVLRVPGRALLALWIHEKTDRFVLLQHDGRTIDVPRWCSEDALKDLLRTPPAQA